jgi:hypothetical protein
MFGDQISNLFSITMFIGCNLSENEKILASVLTNKINATKWTPM